MNGVDMKSLILTSFVFFCTLISMQPAVAAADPHLAFSDLISGPSEGLGDGKGTGAIVTIWGQNLGATPGKVFLIGSDGTERAASYVYYWKPADGQLPSGPSDLFTSHRMYEIAFSLPKSPDGASKIIVQTSGGAVSNALPFTVRAGNIYYVKPTGNNSTGNGSFSSPWQYVNGWSSSQPAPGNMKLQPGDILYSDGVDEPSLGGGGNDAGMFLRGLNGTLTDQIAIVAYPGTHPLVRSPRWGVHPYLSTGIVISKFVVEGGLLDDPHDNSPTFGAGSTSDSTMEIATTENGRIVGNEITDSPGKCSNGWHAAISSGGMGGSNVKVFGNYIHDLGCQQTSHFYHTTYMSKRSTSAQPASQGWEMAWNNLTDNHAVYGIHNYDQSPFDSTNCGDVTGTISIHDNFIKNQRGTGIDVATNDYDHVGYCWTANISIKRNILINTGLGPVSEVNNGTAPYGINVGGDLGGNVDIENNLVLNVSDPSSRLYATAAAIKIGLRYTQNQVLIARNIISINDPIDALVTNNAADQIISNLWYAPANLTYVQKQIESYSGSSGNLFTNPNITVNNDTVTLANTADLMLNQTSLLSASSTASTSSYTGFYGNKSTQAFIGPIIDNSKAPSPPSNISVQ